MALHCVILAAGQGTRMHSSLAKVLHPLAKKPLLQHVIDTAKELQPIGIHVVVGHQRESIQEQFVDQPIHWVTQSQQLGTGHALMQAMTDIPSADRVLILYADVPLITTKTLAACLNPNNLKQNESYLGLVTANVIDPHGLGRIVRDQLGRVQGIVEERDATPLQRQITEIYSGIACASAADLHRWLPQLTNDNAQGEYYLTDIVALAATEKLCILATQADPLEIQGVNNRLQLQTLERAYQQRIANQLMLSGVSLADAARLDVRGQLDCARDVFIDVNVVIEGHVVIGEGASIGPNCVLKDAIIGENCRILANSVLEECNIGRDSQVGPFARIRPGTVLFESCKIGNFVETKNLIMGAFSKANHLSYLGDTVMGQHVNIGAGTITCNYDGVNKHQTTIGDDVFVGSDTQLVAPVTIGTGATIGAGSTIRKQVPAGELTLSDTNQKTIYGWSRPKKRH